MATRHLGVLGLAALLLVGASSATAGSFALVARGDSILQAGQTETFDVYYFGDPGDPDVFGLNLRVVFDTQFSVVTPTASATAVFESPVALILSPGPFDPPIYGVEIGGSQVSGVGISFPIGATKIGEIMLLANGPPGPARSVELSNDPAFTGAIDEFLNPIGDYTPLLLAAVSVPEPGSMLMLGMGLGALAFTRRRV